MYMHQHMHARTLLNGLTKCTAAFCYVVIAMNMAIAKQ